jgi:hypothetical protein
MTSADLIARAMRIAGVLASGETPSAAESADALVIANQMLEAWSAEKLMVFTLTIQQFTLVAGTQSYTMGTGAAFNVARPPKIDYAVIVSLNNPAQPLDLPIKMYTDAEWEEVRVKNLQSSLPQGVYDDGGFPLRTLSYWPIPSVQVQTKLGCWTPLTQLDNTATDFLFPPGYMEAIVYNLAVRIDAEWPGSIKPTAGVIAMEAMKRIKSINITPTVLKCDGITSGGGNYNYLTDNA